MPRKKKSDTKKKTPDNLFHVTLTQSDKVYEGQGETMYDAIAALSFKGADIKTKSIIRATQGEKKVEFAMLPIQVRRMGFHPVNKKFWAKRLEYLIK